MGKELLTMLESDVRIVQLEPMNMAMASGFGPSPEGEAWKKLQTWASSQGLLDNLGAHRYFGYNNPSPAPGSPNYGYDQWMTVGQEVKASLEVRLFNFPGGLYAVTRCQLKNITETWGQLALWRENSPYLGADHQWLEECLTPEVFLKQTVTPVEEAVFDLYLPVQTED